MGVKPNDPLTLAGVSVLVIAITIFASLVLMKRVLEADPNNALQ